MRVARTPERERSPATPVAPSITTTESTRSQRLRQAATRRWPAGLPWSLGARTAVLGGGRRGVLELLLRAEQPVEDRLAQILAEDQRRGGADDREQQQL